MRVAGVGPSSVCRRRIRLAGGRRRDTGRQRGGRRRSSSGDGAQHRRLAQSPRHTRRDIGLATAARTQVVADHRRAQTVEVGHHDAALDPSRHLVDEPGQARVAAEPEDRHLRAEPGHVVEALARCGRWSADAAGSRRTPTCRRRRRSPPGARSAHRRSRPAPRAARWGDGADAARPAPARDAGWCPARRRPPDRSARRRVTVRA